MRHVGELMEVRGKERPRPDALQNVHAHGPRNRKAVARAGSPADLIHDDEASARRRAQDVRRLVHLHEERRLSSREVVRSRPRGRTPCPRCRWRASDAGTKDPIWAMSVISAICRRNVDLPAMFGPVRMTKNLPARRESRLLGTKAPPGRWASTTGCRPSRMVSDASSLMLDARSRARWRQKRRTGRRPARTRIHDSSRSQGTASLTFDAHLQEEILLDLDDPLRRLVDLRLEVGQPVRRDTAPLPRGTGAG